jgi:pyruvate/2-oxoglutarate dehydrogenase complex dihydrolipoamide dehydrogenase (E3) component
MDPEMPPGRVPGDAVMTTTTQAHDLIVIGGSAATGNGQVRLTVETPRAKDFTVTGPQLGRVGLTEAEARAQGGSVRVAALPIKVGTPGNGHGRDQGNDEGGR